MPIWINFMREALAGTPEVTADRPNGIVDRLVDGQTGMPATPARQIQCLNIFGWSWHLSRQQRVAGHRPRREERGGLHRNHLLAEGRFLRVAVRRDGYRNAFESVNGRRCRGSFVCPYRRDGTASRRR